MSDVPRNVERQVESMANVRGLDVKDIRLEEGDSDGQSYRIVIHDEDAEEGENPSFIATRSNNRAGQDMFSQRVEAGVQAIRKKLLGVEDETDQQLQETREKLAESDHPAATGDEVEYGPGAVPNTEGITGGYNDGQVRVESITDADLPEPQQGPDRSTEQQAGSTEQTNSVDERSMQDATQQTTDDTMTLPDDFYGNNAEALLDAKELAEKGHDTAAEALLREVVEEIETYLDDA